MIAQPFINQNYKFFGGKDIPRSAGATAGTLVTPGILAEGEIVITDAGDVILDTTTVLNQPWVKVVMGRGATEPLFQSQLVKIEDLSAYVGKPYAAKVQQVAYWGYNPVANTGSFDVINDYWYTLNISFQELLSQESRSLYNPIVVSYESDSSATEEEITLGLYHELVLQMFNWTKKPTLLEVVNSNTAQRVDATGGAGNITFLKGATTVTLTGGTWGASTIAGAYFTQNSADTGWVYKIASITSTTIAVLEEPFQGDDVTIAFGTARVLPAADAQAANYGIRCTGIEQAYVLDSRPPGLVTFQIGAIAGSTLLTRYAVTPYMGFGTYQLMRDNEAASWRNQGMLYTYTEFPPTTYPTTLTSTQNYSVLNVGIRTSLDSQLSSSKMLANVEIACALDGNVANTFDTNFVGAATSCVDVLDAFASQNPAFSPQAGNL